MADMMAILSVVSFLLAGVFGMASVVLWFRFDIRGIENELSGKRRRGQKAGEEGRRERKVRKERNGIFDETERLDTGSPHGGGSMGSENIMIIHTDEKI